MIKSKMVSSKTKQKKKGFEYKNGTEPYHLLYQTIDQRRENGKPNR